MLTLGTATHVLKAIALGADDCSIGRPYLYGLAAGGEAGVSKVLSIFRTEIERSMTLMGRTRISEITSSDIRHVESFAQARGANRKSSSPPV